MIFGRFSNSPPQAPKSGIDRGRIWFSASRFAATATRQETSSASRPRLFIWPEPQENRTFRSKIPNITPDRETGIGDWKREDIAELLINGAKPDVDNVQGLVDEVIEHGYKNMTKEDALAIADYLKSIPPIKNKIK